MNYGTLYATVEEVGVSTLNSTVPTSSNFENKKLSALTGPRKSLNKPLKGHWTSVTSSSNIFQKKLGFLYY